MFTKIMKWVSIAALLLAALRLAAPSYQALVAIVVCVSALLVVLQAWRAHKYVWGAGFLAIAVLFNPIVLVALSNKIFLWLDWICLAAFLVSLAALKAQPTLAMPSITNPTPESESL